MKAAKSGQRSAVSEQSARGDFLMTVGDGTISVQVGNLTAGELCWLGQLVELMCDPDKAQQWADFKTKARLLCYTEGALEVVTANGVSRCVTAGVNAALQAQARTHQN